MSRAGDANTEQDRETNLEELISILQQHQQNCEDEGKYVEAEMAMNRIKELKKQLKAQQENDFEMAHLADLDELEQAHISEFNKFNEMWDEKMNEFQIHSASLLKALEDKHSEELVKNREELEKTLGANFKASTKLQSLLSTQKNLARQKEYQQAHLVQIKAQELEEQEREKFLQERENKILAFENKLIKKQNVEMDSLRKRIIAGENEQK